MSRLQSRTASCQFQSGTAANLFQSEKCYCKVSRALSLQSTWSIVCLISSGILNHAFSNSLIIDPSHLNRGKLSLQPRRCLNIWFESAKGLRLNVFVFFLVLVSIEKIKHSRHFFKTSWTSSKILRCEPYFQLFSRAPSTLRRRNLKTTLSLWKRIKCFPSTLRRRNLKTTFSLRKCIKCLLSPLRWRNLKTQH